MRQYQFSAFDAYFGFDIPSNALYNQVYMQDSPRYVEYGSNKERSLTMDQLFIMEIITD